MTYDDSLSNKIQKTLSHEVNQLEFTLENQRPFELVCHCYPLGANCID